MLRGVSAMRLDEKGRMTMPKRYRDDVKSFCDGMFVCTIDYQLPCLLLYPLPEWDKIEIKLSSLSSLHPAERRLQRLLLGLAYDCDMDKQGRILIAPALREHAQLKSKAMLVGQLNKFELWNSDIWHQQIERDIQEQKQAIDTLSDRLDNFSL